MKWIGEHISFDDKQDLTTIVIYPKQQFWVNALMGAWLAMWLSIGGIMIWALYELHLTDQEEIILFVFLSFWLYYAIRVGRGFVWLIWGKELIKINETAFVYKRSIKGYGTAKSYQIQNINKMRLHVPKEKSFQAVWEASPWIRGGERLEFDYMGKEIRFGRKLNDKDSKLLFQVITKRIENRLRKEK